MDTRTALKYELADCCNFYEGIDCENEEIAEAIDCFFKKEDIKAFDLFLDDGKREVICSHCCGCPTGQTLFLEVKNENVDRLIELDFEPI